MGDFQYDAINREAVKFRLYQLGTVSDVYSRFGEGRDRLNNQQKVFQNIGETIVLAHWSSATDEERDIETGEFNKVTPTFVFPHDSIIEDDAHVFYKGEEYEITATTNRGNHISAEGKQVNILTKEGGHNHIIARDEDGNDLELPIEP